MSTATAVHSELDSLTSPSASHRRPARSSYTPSAPARVLASSTVLQSFPYTTGYFAFPSGSPPSNLLDAPPSLPTEPPLDDELPEEASSAFANAASIPAPTTSPKKEPNAPCTEGELEWVRAGGTLRDARGYLDPVRTTAARAELDAAAALTSARAAWAAYERRWNALLRAHAVGDAHPLEWNDVPWPTRGATDAWLAAEERAAHSGVRLRMRTTSASLPNSTEPAPTEPGDLTSAQLSAFLLDPRTLASDADARTKAIHHRVRRELLHWHPDKFDLVVLARVPEADDARARVAEGAGRVWRWLSDHGGRAASATGREDAKGGA
jgi:hypothetical protein